MTRKYMNDEYCRWCMRRDNRLSEEVWDCSIQNLCWTVGMEAIPDEGDQRGELDAQEIIKNKNDYFLW